MARKINPHTCEIGQEGSEHTVHFYVNKIYSSTDSFDDFLDAAGAMQHWLKVGNETMV